MRRWIGMAAALLLLAFLPKRGTELGELHPAAVLAVWKENADILLETDAGDAGRGETLALALENMQKSTSGHLLLDTVENLIICEQTRNLLPDLQKLLRPSVRVCLGERMDLAAAWEYLKIHIPRVLLSEENGELQYLKWGGERYEFGEGG